MAAEEMIGHASKYSVNMNNRLDELDASLFAVWDSWLKCRQILISFIVSNSIVECLEPLYEPKRRTRGWFLPDYCFY